MDDWRRPQAVQARILVSVYVSMSRLRVAPGRAELEALEHMHTFDVVAD